MTRYWFRPKRYGYGATPSTWEGWAFTGLVVAIVAVAASLLFRNGHAPGMSRHSSSAAACPADL